MYSVAVAIHQTLGRENPLCPTRKGTTSSANGCISKGAPAVVVTWVPYLPYRVPPLMKVLVREVRGKTQTNQKSVLFFFLSLVYHHNNIYHQSSPPRIVHLSIRNYCIVTLDSI